MNTKLLPIAHDSTQRNQSSVASGFALPLTDDELDRLFLERGTAEKGKMRIRLIRKSLPGRVTRTNKCSGKIRYPSIKMGFVIEAEAFHTELIALAEWDHDSDTIELYSQPPEPLKVTYRSVVRNRNITFFTTPDAFRITNKHFIFVECKTEEFLLTESEVHPERYVRQTDGSWRSPPGEVAAAEFGCLFELRSTKQNNYVLHENVDLLDDFYRGNLPKVPDEVRSLLHDRMHGHGFLSAFELIHVQPSISADHLYNLLVTGGIYFPLHALRLADQNDALFFLDVNSWHAHEVFTRVDKPGNRRPCFRTELRANDRFTWNGVIYEIVNPGQSMLSARSVDNNAQLIDLAYEELERLWPTKLQFHEDKSYAGRTYVDDRMKAASPADLQEAVWRYQILFGTPDKLNNLTNRKARVRFLWQKEYRHAEERWGNGFVGLLNNRHGNRQPKVSHESKSEAVKTIEDDWETYRRKGRLASYGKYKNAVAAQGFEAVSYVTFCQYIKDRRGNKQEVSRIGEKAAYDTEPQYLELERTTQRHGTHCWHIGHIDHTPLPLKFVHSRFGDIVDTVWLTILVDAFTRKILAYYLTFDEPSYRSCMMVLRDCVRRHGRVHQWIVTDGGSDFNSIYYEQLLARLAVKKRDRLLGKPKFGSVCERVFGTTQTQFITNLLGSTDIAEKYFRAISPEVQPSRHAVWILDKFDLGFEKYLTEIYHTSHHSGIDMSPDAADVLSAKSHGDRGFRPILYDENFIAETCPGVTKGVAKVHPQGVKINYRWFKCDGFNAPGVLGSKVSARYDPWNAGIGYVFLNEKWALVRSEYYAIFEGKSERLMQFATQAMLLDARKRGTKAVINAQKIAQFLMTMEGQEVIANQKRNDMEATTHREKINQPKNRPVAINSSVSNVVLFPSAPSSSQTVPRVFQVLDDL